MSASAPTANWVVSTRVGGEVLVARASMPGLELLLLGAPSGFTRSQIESRLREVASAASESAARDQRPKPFPAILHHALTGLLSSGLPQRHAIKNNCL